MTRERFVIVVEPAPDRLDRPAMIRLRGFLKTALRGFALRAVEVRPAQPDELNATAAAPAAVGVEQALAGMRDEG